MAQLETLYRTPCGSIRAEPAERWAFRSLAVGVKFLGMIPKDLLDLLVCPACKKPLTLQGEGQSLKCGACRRVYPVRDSIPILLIDEATLDPS
jgi:uncharacterized protein YbaR (Trm112 family)